jgi:hypothetical protein
MASTFTVSKAQRSPTGERSRASAPKLSGAGGTTTTPQYAITFTYAASTADQVVDEVGSTFVGLVEGGGAASVLELATASGNGTITGIGTQFVGFGTIAVDAGATWNMTGADTIAATTVGTHTTNGTLNNAGTIDLTGTLTLGSGGALSNNNLIKISGGEFLANIGVGAAGSLEISSGGWIDFASAVTSGTIDFLDATGNLILADPAGVTLALNGFVQGDEIDLPGVTYDTGHMTATYSGGQLSVYDNGTLKADIHLSGFSTNSFIPANDGTGHTEVTVLCFVAGAGISTPKGEILVENLSIGDMVQTWDGKAEPIVWIGTGRVLVTPTKRSAATPVIVRKGALADNVPHRDLRVTKGHALFIDGVLIPVEELVNHRSIIWDDHAREVEIYHIELPRHAVLIANGAPAESYRDDGNRWLFQNANSGWTLPPQPPCAPVLTRGPIIDAIWRRLLDRAGPRPGLPLTDDPDLHLIVDGLRLDGTMHGNLCAFRMPRRPTSVRIVSHAAAQAELGIARDPRVLGVAIRQITIWQGRDVTVINASNPDLTDGFHRYESDNDFRWTNGNAALPPSVVAKVTGPTEIKLQVACIARYPLLSKGKSRAA